MMASSVSEQYDGICHIACAKEQSGLSECMASIQNANENGSKANEETRQCLKPLVAAWTECCLKASIDSKQYTAGAE
jgi:hypothetical protein